MDGVTIASQLAMSAGYVIKNADTNIAAVDKLAEKYLTAAQRAELGAQTTGASSVSPLLLAGLLGVGLLVFRARR
jgi:MYXO-CTERM domain-containing protein